MSDVLYEVQNKIGIITLNRVEKRNAFDDVLIKELQHLLDHSLNDLDIRALLLQANGNHFCAGADLSWMRKMANFSADENFLDSLALAKLMFSLHHYPKPTIAMIQGSAFGGGAGFAAACDIAIAADTAQFCFSEVKLGLIPAVISPYVINAIGSRNAQMLFITAELINAQKALTLGLIQHCVPEKTLQQFTFQILEKIAKNAPVAIQKVNKLIHHVRFKPIDHDLMEYTARSIAETRISKEGQTGLNAFLNKMNPQWD